MIDQFGRSIDYIRISITDRCNLRCFYCMPAGCAAPTHEDSLSFDDLLRVCRAAVSLGITKFKITGGEPLLRQDCNRVRLTSAGLLKPCLCFNATLDVRALLRSGCDDAELTKALQSAVYQKPRAHCFDEQTQITERRLISQIGG